LPDIERTPVDTPEQSEARAWVYYTLQLVFCYPLTMLAIWPASALLRMFGLAGEHPA
jgi:hypothetical protein